MKNIKQSTNWQLQDLVVQLQANVSPTLNLNAEICVDSSLLSMMKELKMQYIKLEYLLKSKGSATKLAERSGVPQSHLTRWKQAGAIVEVSTGVVYLPSATAHRLRVDEVMELAMELEAKA